MQPFLEPKIFGGMPDFSPHNTYGFREHLKDSKNKNNVCSSHLQTSWQHKLVSYLTHL
jgi:hypothetical protein